MSGPLRCLPVCVLLVASLSACTAALLGGAADGGYNAGGGQRSAALVRQDAGITSAINASFVRDASINALDIRVSTYRGVVTLDGMVASQAARQRALALAHAVSGVKRVINRLRIVPG